MSSFLGLDIVDNLEIAAVLHGMNKSSRKRAVVRGKHGDRQILGVCVDGETEKNQLNDGDAKHHRKGETVTPHLDEFLADDRGEANEVERHRNHDQGPRERRGTRGTEPHESGLSFEIVACGLHQADESVFEARLDSLPGIGLLLRNGAMVCSSSLASRPLT